MGGCAFFERSLGSRRANGARAALSLIAVLAVLAMSVLSAQAAPAASNVTGSNTPGVDPDTYSCPASGYIDFENLADGTNLSANAIKGVQFTTTGGFTWLVGDFATGNYNGKYPTGSYTSQGTHWAWLGESQGAGRIDFVKGPASNFSFLTSDNTPVQLDAYDSSNNLLATAGPATPNIDTGKMDLLKVTSTTRNIAYVIIHDSGNFFDVDSVCTDAPGVTRGSVVRINRYGGPMCADKKSAVRVDLAVHPKSGTTVGSVTDPVMHVTKIDTAPNAWLIHLKSNGTASIPAHNVTVVVHTAGGDVTTIVGIPAFSCG